MKIRVTFDLSNYDRKLIGRVRNCAGLASRNGCIKFIEDTVVSELEALEKLPNDEEE